VISEPQQMGTSMLGEVCGHDLRLDYSISAENTFEQDVQLAEMEPIVRRLAEQTWEASRKESRIAHTVILKLKTSDFRILTRSHTPVVPPSSCEEVRAKTVIRQPCQPSDP